MSLPVLTWVLDHSEATGGARLVLLVIAEHAHDDGSESYPAVDTIARRARMSRRGVQEALRRLETDGHIERDGVSRKGTTVYRVLMAGGAQDMRGGADRDQQGRGMAHGGGAADAPEPSLEPSGKRSERGERARATAATLPEDFPESLATHAEQAHRVLVSVAEQHNAREVTLRAVALTMLAHPGRRFVAEAHSLAAWAQAPPRPIRDVVSTYRTWLGRAERHAGVEQLGGEAVPALFDPGANVRPLRRNGRSTPADYQALKGTL